MNNDDLLHQWKSVIKSCNKIIDISIRSNILRLPTQKQTKQQFIHVYDLVYKLCSNPIGVQSRVTMVYKDFKDILKSGLLLMSKQIIQQRQIYRLGMLRKICDAYEDALKRIKHMFALLDRPNIIKQAKTDELDRTGVTIIVTTLFTQQSVLQYDAIYFKSLTKVRKNKDLSDANFLKDYVQILYRFHVRLSKKQTKKTRTIYTDFQQKYLTNAKQYYTLIFHRLQQLSPSQYFMQVNNLYQFQSRITQQCFGTSSDSFINKIFAAQFLQEYRDKLIKSPKGLKYILQNRQAQTVTVIADLYKKLTNSIDGFKDPFESFVYQQIASLILQVKAELLLKKSQQLYLNFIQKLIDKNIELISILQTSFMKFRQFNTYYRVGVQKAIYKNPLSVPIQQMLACYVDQKFKTVHRQQNLVKEDINNVQAIFECLENKDLFLMKYLQKLARKIMNITLNGIQNHEQLIHFLKIHSGNKMTEKLQTIITQYKISIQNEKQFKTIIQQQKIPYSINLYLFSESAWPSQQFMQFRDQQLAQIFKKGLNCIKFYQKSKQQKKIFRISFIDSKIRWTYYFQKQVQNKFPEAYFDTNGIQAILLYYIYQHRPDKISLRLLTDIFNQIKPMVIRQSLSKMCEPHESPILIHFEEEDDQHYYQFNSLMKSRKRIIQYDLLVQEQQQEQQLFQKNQLNKEREFAIDANIIKLMKTKRVFGIDKIIEEVTKMIKVFTPQTRDIKSSIERLIAKQMLARQDKDRNLIKYKN